MIDIFQGTGAPLTAGGITGALNLLRLPGDVVGLWSVIAVETRGFGYLPDRRPKILFERHIFSQRTRGVFDAKYPDISNPVGGGYSGGAAEYLRLKRAMLLDREHALESASWGLGQVMGFNAAGLGYANVQAMIDAFCASEDRQLDGCARFIAANTSLRTAFGRGDWARVAYFYNGRDYAKNAYDRKLAASQARFSTGALPDIDLRAAQARLSYLGYAPGSVDGEMGAATEDAISRFQKDNQKENPKGNTKDFDLKVTGRLDKLTAIALRMKADI